MMRTMRGRHPTDSPDATGGMDTRSYEVNRLMSHIEDKTSQGGVLEASMDENLRERDPIIGRNHAGEGMERER